MMVSGVLIGVLIGGCIGIIGQIISHFLDHKNKIKRINYEKKLEIFFEISKDLEREWKEYYDFLRRILENKKIKDKDINYFKKIYSQNEKRETSFKIAFFNNKEIKEISQNFYKHLEITKKIIEKKEFNEQNLKTIRQSLIELVIHLENAMKKELKI